MLQLHDSMPFVTGLFALPDARGVECVVVVVKATFEIAAGLTIAAEQRPIVLADEYYGAPETSSLRYANEVHPRKPGTDVLVIGEACAPGERPVTELDVIVRVAGRQGQARVHGDRYWTEGLAGLQPSRAAPFVRMPMIYERAFGGAAEPRNPVGLGAIGDRAAAQLLGHPVPNIDDPRQPLTKLGQSPTPLGFGPLTPSWPPRVGFAGTYDQRWLDTRAPHLPLDFDPRFFVTAPAELSFAQGLRGGEPIAILGMHPRGPCEFTLPQCRFDVDIRVAGQSQRPQLELDTVVLEPTDARLTMSWRAVVPVDKQILRVERVRVVLDELHGASEPRRAGA